MTGQAKDDRRKALLATLVALVVGAIPVWGGEHLRRPDVVLITLDTTRADHLGCYGYERPTSPNLDRLAARSVVYDRCVAPASWTLPAHASLFTGKLPTSHGARYDPQGPLHLTDAIAGPSSWRVYRARGLARAETTLASILADAGYRTGGVVGGPWLKRVFGLDRGFEHWDDEGISSVAGRRAAEVTDHALAWVEGLGHEPLFLFVNYFDPHSPYAPPPEYATAFLPGGPPPTDRKPTLAEWLALYDGEILYMDHHVGRLLDGLAKLRRLDETLVIVTADHGELFGEHGRYGHGLDLFQPELAVPLVVSRPGAAPHPGRSDALVQLNDVMAIVLSSLGLPMPPGVQSGRPPAPGHPVVAEAYPLPELAPGGHWRALFEGRYKLLWNSHGLNLLFDLESDPGETRNLAPRQGELVASMLRRLDTCLAKLPKPGPPAPEQTVDDETRKALEGLGYVDH